MLLSSGDAGAGGEEKEKKKRGKSYVVMESDVVNEKSLYYAVKDSLAANFGAMAVAEVASALNGGWWREREGGK